MMISDNGLLYWATLQTFTITLRYNYGGKE